MASNLDLDPNLVERALALSGAPTKKAAVTAALQEFIARREQRRILRLAMEPSWAPPIPSRPPWPVATGFRMASATMAT